ncbi:MAG: hypothetical protein IAG13_22160 [Deltaproteobacteria bacterium]|nr:hypothetical protein [Nannocystaceae bacterium]
MHRIASISTTAGWLAALTLATTSCTEDTAPIDDADTSADGGINSISDPESSSASEPTEESGSADTTAGSGGSPDCNDGIVNGDETDLDCGGSCDPCADGAGCMVAADCYSLVCDGGTCEPPSCYDEAQNGNEDGIDCGGGCPNPCGSSGGCTDDDQCADTEFCSDDGECLPAACDNSMRDSAETDVDCGGIDCPDCDAGLECNIDGDCLSHVCELDVCVAPACDDNEQNGDETDEDCGGSCPDCGNSQSCEVAGDCISGVCEDNNCEAPGCNDGVQNGDETDEDCGGGCPDCDPGDGCAENTDCDTQICELGVCQAASCDDEIQNGDETDEDCGGACGATCIPGEDCSGGDDCVQQICEFGVCSLPDCTDDAQNGDETDLDCGGACGDSCVPGQSCSDGGDCVEGVCSLSVCADAACDDAVRNGDETDIDCGQSCGSTCDTGDSCLADDDCISDVCVLNTCQAPTCDDEVANGMELGVDCEGGCPNPCDVDGENVVNTYLLDSQLAPVVGAAPDGSYYVVVWTSVPVVSPAQDGSGHGVYGQIYDSAGAPSGGEFLVNTTTVGNQGNASVAVYDAGFVVTWESPDTDSGGVFAKRYTNAGAVATAEFQVNGSDTGLQRRPDVAADNGGAFVICYEHRPMASYEILCRRYNSSAVAQGVEIAVNSTVVGDQQLPTVGRASSGDFTVAWQGSNAQDGDDIGVIMRRYDNAGVALTGEAVVNNVTADNQSQPAIGMNASGAFVIAWSSDLQDGASTGVAAQRFDALGAEQGAEFVANTYTTGAQNNPAVALNADGEFMLAWVSANQDGSLTGVYAQRYTNAGAAVGVEFRVNTTTTQFQEEPDLTLRGADEPIVVFSSGSATDRDIRVKRYDANFP